MDGPLEHALTHEYGLDLERTLINAVYQTDCKFCLVRLALMVNKIGLVPY